MAGTGRPLCLVIGSPKGFTRSVLEALLKRGSKVFLSCSDEFAGLKEKERLSSLYGQNRVFFSHADSSSKNSLENVFSSALSDCGEISCVVNSTADQHLKISARDIISQGHDLIKVDRLLTAHQVRQDVSSLQRVAQLATKYMGTHNGFSGGTLLSLVSNAELSPSVQTSTTNQLTCSVLGTTRALGTNSKVARHGVRTVTVYQPCLEYEDSDFHLQTSENYPQWDKYSEYTREYTGYMALHTGTTQPPGTAWAFNKELRLQEVTHSNMPSSCRIANKMCFWLGCPMLEEKNEDYVGDDLRIRHHEHGGLEKETFRDS